jgi:fatty acid desaturase
VISVDHQQDTLHIERHAAMNVPISRLPERHAVVRERKGPASGAKRSAGTRH